MDYIRQAAEIIPAAAGLAAVLYGVFCFVRRRKRPWGELRAGRLAAEYLFTATCIMIGLITLTNQYGNFGEFDFNTNLIVFKAFADAVYKGNDLGVKQYFLNILMFVPYGLLLPMAFPKKMQKRYMAAFIVLLTTVGIETIQLFIGRSFDVDDIVANFAGGLAGIFVFICFDRFLSKNSLWKQICLADETTADRQEEENHEKRDVGKWDFCRDSSSRGDQQDQKSSEEKACKGGAAEDHL